MSDKNFRSRVEFLALKVGVKIYYDPKEEWFVVNTGDGKKFKNINLWEAVDVALKFVEDGDGVEEH